MDSAIVERRIQDALANHPELRRGKDGDRIENAMREILSEFPNGCGVKSGLAEGEANQRALDAWIEAGAIPGDEHLYGRVGEDVDGE